MTIRGPEAFPSDVLGALRPFAELPAWLLRAMDTGVVGSALAARVPELADGTLRLLTCTPTRLRAKGEQWLTRYELLVADPFTSTTRPVVLVGQLEPPTTGPFAAANGSGRFGDPDWVGAIADLRLRLRTEAADHRLPALPVLADPSSARDLLERAIDQQAHPGIRIAEARPEIVRYKPGSRCTVRYELRYDDPRPGWPDVVVAKIHQGDKGGNAFAAMTALWATELAAGEAVQISEPLAYLPEQRVLLQAGIAGSAGLTDLVRSALLDGDERLLTELRTRLHQTARGLAALHRCGVRHGRAHTWEDELAELREVTARLGATIPTLAAAADPLLNRLRELAAGAPADPVGPAHHDFRPGQVMVHDGGVGFIDFDGCCTAEPALDIGRFRAKLRDVGVFTKDAEAVAPTGVKLAERIAAVDELCDGFLEDYLRYAPVSRTRVLAWETIDLLTAVLHAWTKVRTARIAPRVALLEHQVRRLFDSQGD